MTAPIRLGITIHADGGAQVTGELNRVRGGLDGANQAAQNTNRSFAQMARETLGLGSAVRGLAASLSVVALYQTIKDLVRTADMMKLLDVRILLATKSLQDYAYANAALVAISMRTGTSFEANATLFSRINASLRTMGGTTQTTLQFTELLAEGLRISGASAGETASVIRQFSQAMASGVLRGDEFNSIMENGSRVALALATGLGVDIGVLRKMAEAGELTASKVANALLSQSAIIDSEFKRIPLTVGAAWENLTTAFGQYISTADQGTGATGGLSGAIDGLAHNLNTVLSILVTLGKVGVGYFTGSLAAGAVAYGRAVLVARAQTQALAVEAVRAAAAQIAGAEALVIGSQAALAHARASAADVAATEAVILAARGQTLAQLAVTQQSIASTQVAAITAMSVTVQSTAIIYLRAQAETTLAIAEARRTAIVTELAALGRQQTVIATGLAAALAAQTAAENAAAVAAGRLASLTTSAAGGVSLLSRAMGFLGGPIGVITTLLGLGVTAWLVWGGTASTELSATELKAKQAADVLEARQVSLMDTLRGTWVAIGQSAQESSGLTASEWAVAMGSAKSSVGGFATLAGSVLDAAWATIKSASALTANHLIGLFVGVGTVVGQVFAVMAMNI
jgi:tape measure domain-containing protein